MTKLTKQLLATIIIVTLGLIAINAAVHIAMLTIDNTQTLSIVTLGLSIWIGGLTLYILSRIIADIGHRPTPPATRSTIFTEQQLTQRDRQQTITKNQTSHPTAYFNQHQDSLKRKYAHND